MAAKRSPILGYNHNVRYRGLVFHVQTEDSGLLSPHLFTHLFHGGVILSTRKLVYDAGAAEDAIKNLMQSQHKIVLKDLKNGAFDDKIDVYLAGTEGLLPRSTPAAAKAAKADDIPVPEDDDRRSVPEIVIQRPGTEEIALEAMELVDEPSAPHITIEPGPAIARTATPPPIPRAATPAPVPMARTQTAERKSAPTAVRTKLPSAPPPPDLSELDPPTDPDIDSGAIAAAINATVKTPMVDPDSAPEISIKLDLEDDPGHARTRSKHDTEVEIPTDLGGRAATLSDGIPGQIGAAQSGRGSDSVPPPTTSERKTGERAAGMSAAALPPARPISRPPSRQAITPPAVVSRTIPPNEEHSGAVEVYAPPPSSVDPPPGERSQRAGQYAQHKRPSGGLSVDVIKNNPDRSGAAAIPSGLARPGRPPSGSMPALGQQNRAASQSSPPTQPRTQSPVQPVQPVQPAARTPSQQHSVSRPNPPSTPPPSAGRTPTPPRVSASSSNTAQNRSGSGSGGVVMTRPAVIVGAPAKTTNPPRVRKAREEEGRGFGQGLISEKSLDEVILAYLSEDADDK